MGVVIFNNVPSTDVGFHVETPPSYEFPERDYEIIHIPGRNGDVVIDKGTYANVSKSYNISFGCPFRNFSYFSMKIAEWLGSASGYCRLEDTYEPEHYRVAIYKESSYIQNILENAGRATLVFDCKPQRFLKNGDYPFIFETSETVISNPTLFNALPIIEVFGSGTGTVKIGKYDINISFDSVESIIINSETQDAYKGVVNLNSLITLGHGFPKLVPGDNEIIFTGGVTRVEVIPKWWTL